MDRKGLLPLIYFGAFIGPFAGNLVLPLIPLLESDFNVGIEIVALTITAAIIPFAVVQAFSGAISDIYGRKNIVVLGFAISTAGAVLAAASLNIDMLLGARVVQGVGSAFIAPIMLAMIGDHFSYAERGKIMGGYAAAVSAGLALGPIVGGLLALYGWRYAFMLMATLSAVVIPICAVYFKSTTQPEKAVGTLPKTLVSTLRQSNVSLSCAIGLLVFLVAGSTVTFLSDYLGKPPFLVNAAEIGFLLFIGGVASIAVAPVVGFMIGTVGRRKTAVIGGVLTLLAFVVFMLIGGTYWEFFTPLIILFVGQILVFTALGTVVIDSSSHSRGAASSIFNTFRFTGYGLGPALMSPVYVGLGFTATLGSFTLLAAVALLLMVRLRTTNSTV